MLMDMFNIGHARKFCDCRPVDDHRVHFPCIRLFSFPIAVHCVLSTVFTNDAEANPYHHNTCSNADGLAKIAARALSIV